jgi:NAD-dependent dihydropyrimidine dehydrogenase PreA subunit
MPEIVDACDGSPQRAGKVAPVIDRDRCEGKADCVRVCPFDVFRIEVLSRQQRAALTWRGRLKAWAHGGRQAAVVNAEACHACQLCVAACPEQAIRLAPLGVRRTNG